MKGDHNSLHNLTIFVFLYNLIYLEPLNLFLYTWRFLRELELEEKNHILKRFYWWFARASIVLLPAAFCCIVPAYIIEYARYVYYLEHFDLKEGKHY